MFKYYESIKFSFLGRIKNAKISADVDIHMCHRHIVTLCVE